LSIQGQGISPERDAAPTLPPAFPPALAFLQAHGVPVAVLEEAVRLAESAGVTPHEALLRHGLLDERTYCRAVADELALPFIEDGDLVHESASYPWSAQSGFLRLKLNPTGARMALAPGGDDIERLGGAAGRLTGLAIMPSRALRAGVLQRCGEAAAWDAANALSEAEPHRSARDGATLWQKAVLIVLAGLIPASFVLPALALLLGTFAAALFLAMVTLRLAALAHHAPVAEPACPRRADRELPVYTILVPLLHETSVLSRLVAALLALDYPRAKLDIKLVVEADDAETRAALDAMELPGCFEIVVAPDGQPRTKPRALNVALPLARGAFTVVYDAEDVPAPDQLRLAVERFRVAAPSVACLQARLVVDNGPDGWLARCFALEYAALFDVVNPALAAYGLPMPLGGTSNHFRTETLRELHGWDAWNVTEDADLGLRLALAGYHVEDLASPTYEEALSRFGPWLRQRSRWMKGFLQVCLTHTRRPRDACRRLGLGRYVAALVLVGGTVITALVYPVLALGTVFLLAWHGWPEAASPWELPLVAFAQVLLGLGPLALIGTAFVGLARRRWWDCLPWLLDLPFYYALVRLAAWRGLWELMRAPFHWHKTEHGLARTSRSGHVRAPGRAPPPPRPPAEPD
jgi:cellulose synthase/poly-beta-1,6-N-acetylglucosamine synthase-like glycosyltransferase